VPLRTYLPDGDIDISMFFPLHGPVDPLKDTWGTQLLKALEREAGRRDAPFRIRNCQIIQAEFKLVKFVVADVVVDVSFNALGGLCTVAFLEWADRTIGRNHLFKRSIVLVKAWCYYESRLLGAHHGLISSYALEAMVLYVFNLYGTTLSSPLQVLHKFLKVLGAFDWDKYALSVLGPIDLESLPQPRLAMEAMPKEPTLIDPQELQDAVQRYSGHPNLASSALDGILKSIKAKTEGEEGESGKPDEENGNLEEPVTIALPRKYLNIMDPLLPTNNLGRSVSKTSYFRIKKALAFGARQLDDILKLEPLAASEGIAAYFENTWRSPTRMAADNQVFQNRLAMGGGAALMQGATNGGGNGGGGGLHYQRVSYSGGGGALGGGHGSNVSRSFSRKLSNSISLPELAKAASDKSVSTAGEQQRGFEEGGGAAASSNASTPAPAATCVAGSSKPPLPPSPSPTPPEITGSASSPMNTTATITPPLSPVSGTGSPGRVSTHSNNATASSFGGGGSQHRVHTPAHHQSAWAAVNNGYASTTSPGQQQFVAMIPVEAGDGRRAFHASLPTSPVLTGAPMVSLQPVQMHQHQHYHGNAHAQQQPHHHVNVVVPHISTSRDIFMADLDAVMANLELAREWQQPRLNTSSSRGGGGASSGSDANVVDKYEENVQKQDVFTSGAGKSTAAGTATGGGRKREQNQRQLPHQLQHQHQQHQPSDALEAAMAALPHLRVSAPVSDSYATVTAQGLTPLTVPNSQADSGAVSAVASAGSSAANTPRAALGPATVAIPVIAGTTSKKVSREIIPTQQLQEQQQQQQSGKPPLPSHSAPGSDTTTPKQQSSASPVAPKRPWGRGAGGAASVAAAAPGGVAAQKEVAGGGGTGWSAVASRQPSRLGQMHGTSESAKAEGTATTTAATVGDERSPDPVVVVAEDSNEWPAFSPKDASTSANKATESTQPASGVWGSIPPFIKSEANPPAGNSPASTSWAAAAASPKKTTLMAASSPKAGAPAASGNRRRNKTAAASSSSSPTAATQAVVAAKEKKKKKKKEEEQEFSLRTDEFPTL